MTLFGDTWSYLTDPANWQGPGGMIGAPRRVAPAEHHRTRPGGTDRPAGGAVAGPPGSRRVPGDQHLQRRPCHPDVRAAGAAGDGGLPRHPGVRPLRPGRPRDADRAHALRPSADHHQRLRRHPRGARRRQAGRRGDGHDQGTAVLPRRAPPRPPARDVRRSARARPGVGHRHHRRHGRRAGARPRHHRRVLPLRLRQGHRRRRRRRGGRAGPRAADVRASSEAWIRHAGGPADGQTLAPRSRSGHDWPSKAGSGHARCDTAGHRR